MEKPGRKPKAYLQHVGVKLPLTMSVKLRNRAIQEGRTISALVKEALETRYGDKGRE